MLRIIFSLLCFLCCICLFFKFPPEKGTPTLLFPSREHNWTLIKSPACEPDWTDESPLCTYTHWNFAPTLDYHIPILKPKLDCKYRTEVSEQLVYLSHFSNYLQSNVELFEGTYIAPQLSRFLIPKALPKKLGDKHVSQLRLRCFSKDKVICEKMLPSPFPLNNNENATFYYEGLLYVEKNQPILLTQKFSGLMEWRDGLQSLIRSEMADLYLSPGIYQIRVE